MSKNYVVMIVFVLLVDFCSASAHAMSFEESVELVRSGSFEFPGIANERAEVMDYWRASELILETAKANPDQIAKIKDIVVKEVQRLDQWDHFTEMSGDYKLSLIKALIEIEDPDLMGLFIKECQHGNFVAKGLSRLGSRAIKPIVRELEYLGYAAPGTCLQTALIQMAEEILSPDSILSDSEKEILRGELKNLAIPAVIRYVDDYNRQRRESGKYTEAGLAQVREISTRRLVELERLLN